MNDLEILTIAYETVTGNEDPWHFAAWSQCACGHIYAAANEVPIPTLKRYGLGFQIQDPRSDGGDYERVMGVVCVANGIDTRHRTLGDALSHYIYRVAGRDHLDERIVAGQVIMKAIEYVMEQERTAMHLMA